MNTFTSQWPVRNFVCQQFYRGKYLLHVQEFQSASRPTEVEEFIICVMEVCISCVQQSSEAERSLHPDVET